MNTNSHPEWQTRQFRAMGCQYQIWLEADERLARELLAEAEELVRYIERKLTRFDASSELNRVNENSGRWVKVSLALWDALWFAKLMAAETNGLYDPALLAAVENTGYDVSFDEINKPRQNESQPKPVFNFMPENWRRIQFRENPAAVWLPEGARIDLGGIGKGFAAQRLVAFLKDYGPCLVDAGGDLSAGDAPSGYAGWPVAINVPLSGLRGEGQDVIALWLARESLATSGIDYRRWLRNGKQKHHIIDPRTGEPAQTDIISASVLVPTGVEAEALATAALVAGLGEATSMLEETRKAAVLVEMNGQIHLTGSMHHRANWQLPVSQEWNFRLGRSVYHAVSQ